MGSIIRNENRFDWRKKIKSTVTSHNSRLVRDVNISDITVENNMWLSNWRQLIDMGVRVTIPIGSACVFNAVLMAFFVATTYWCAPSTGQPPLCQKVSKRTRAYSSFSSSVENSPVTFNFSKHVNSVKLCWESFSSGVDRRWVDRVTNSRRAWLP